MTRFALFVALICTSAAATADDLNFSAAVRQETQNRGECVRQGFPRSIAQHGPPLAVRALPLPAIASLNQEHGNFKTSASSRQHSGHVPGPNLLRRQKSPPYVSLKNSQRREIKWTIHSFHGAIGAREVVSPLGRWLAIG
jgi:hypothetical protein